MAAPLFLLLFVVVVVVVVAVVVVVFVFYVAVLNGVVAVLDVFVAVLDVVVAVVLLLLLQNTFQFGGKKRLWQTVILNFNGKLCRENFVLVTELKKFSSNLTKKHKGIEIVVTPREKDCLVGLAWAIYEKILAWLYIIIGFVAAYYI